MEGTTVKNPKLVKMLTKLALGAVFSAAIGYTIKIEKKLEERIDDHFDETETDQPN